MASGSSLAARSFFSSAIVFGALSQESETATG